MIKNKKNKVLKVRFPIYIKNTIILNKYHDKLSKFYKCEKYAQTLGEL